MSLKFALEELLPGKCYHMYEMAWPEYIGNRNDHVEFWKDALDGKTKAKDIVRFLREKGYR